MILPESLPQLNVTQTSNTIIVTMIPNEHKTAELTSVEEKCSSLTSIKIPLVSFEPILATSTKHILVNEYTKRRNQLVLYDDHLQKFTIRSLIKQSILDALWYEIEQYFLILTATNVFTFDPISKTLDLLHDLIPTDNKIFKCFTLLNSSTLLIGYDEWNVEYLDKWQQNQNGLWTRCEQIPLRLTSNEFIGSMTTIHEDDYTNLAIIIYNTSTEQWRLELRHADTLARQKAILLPESNTAHDYRIISIQNAQSDIKWLVFSSGNSIILAIDSQWKKTQLNYKHPVQRMALFNKNYLIVRTTERVDIHSFL